MTIEKMIKQAREDVYEGGWEIKDIIEQYKQDQNFEMFVLRLAYLIELYIQDTYEDIRDEDQKLEDQIIEKLRKHRHLADGSVVIPL